MSRSRAPKQLSFLPALMPNYRPDHGGDLNKGKRKRSRPFSHKHAIHVVLRSSRAKEKWSLLTRKNKALVHELVYGMAKRCNIRIYSFVNVGNHLHLLVKAESHAYHIGKQDFQAFLRRVAGQIAFKVTGTKKANPIGKFWDKLAYSRLVNWGKHFENLKDYLIKNMFEACGAWNRKLNPQYKLITVYLREAGVGPPE